MEPVTTVGLTNALRVHNDVTIKFTILRCREWRRAPALATCTSPLIIKIHNLPRCRSLPATSVRPMSSHQNLRPLWRALGPRRRCNGHVPQHWRGRNATGTREQEGGN